jgi:RNA polymerase sigma-70 factor, ECF subfamily
MTEPPRKHLSFPIFDRLSAAVDVRSEDRAGTERFIYRSTTVMIISVQLRASCIHDSDDDVIGLVERGELRTALHHLMKQHRAHVYRFCRAALCDPVLADDVCQQIFIQAFRDLPQFKGRSKIRIWLFAIARHRVLDAARARRRAQAHQQDSPAMDPPDPRVSPAESLDEMRLREALVDSLERLDDAVRSAVLLRYQQGLTFQEMAAICREKPGTLAARVTRALPLLRADIESRIRCAPERMRCQRAARPPQLAGF